jgi:N-acetylmuramoyl-L-alanine amidase
VLLALLACARPDPAPPAPNGAFALPGSVAAEWPSPAARVRAVSAAPPPSRPLVVAIDPGHGTATNRGAISSFGAEECRHTHWFSRLLLDRLAPLRTVDLRPGDPGPSYAARVARAQDAGADALISIHADARGLVSTWSPRPGETWRIATSSPGFSILWSGRGPLGPRREALARALARRLAEAGFLPYDGADYTGLYETDAEVPGVFRDLRGLYVLREPTIPSVIVETHNALDLREVYRWAEPGVAEAFADALRAGVIDALHPTAADR